MIDARRFSAACSQRIDQGENVQKRFQHSHFVVRNPD
jgi:hypothetical protein